MQPSSQTQAILDAAPGTDDALARDLGLLIRGLLARSNRDVFAEIDELGLTFTQSKIVMQFIGREHPRSVKEIADLHGLSLPAASRAVDSLQKLGLVTRTEDPHDRRIKQIAPTDKARAIAQRQFDLRVAGIREFVSQLDPVHRQRLAEALAPIVPPDNPDALFPVLPAEKDTPHA